jgi:hypothetical protein
MHLGCCRHNVLYLPGAVERVLCTAGLPGGMQQPSSEQGVGFPASVRKFIGDSLSRAGNGPWDTV